MAQSEHANITGSLICLMNCRRPNIAFVVGTLTRFTHNPTHEHWKEIDRILTYHKGTIIMVL